MNVVVDTSIIIAVIANGKDKPALVRQTAGVDLLAPRSVHWEIGNAFSAMLKRKRISIAQAKAALSIYERIPIRYFEIDLSQALELASQLGIYAYDAYILACAANQKAPLLTLDGGLIHAASRGGIKTLEVSA